MTVLSCLIGLIQMTVVMLVAGIVARSLRTRAPSSAANVGLLGLLCSLSLMLLTLMNAPRAFEAHVAVQTEAANASALTSENPGAIGLEPQDHSKKTDPQPSIGLSLHDAIGWLSLQPMSNVQHRSLIACTPWVLVLFTSIAVLPVAVGLLATVQFHHSSIRISDHDAVTLRTKTTLGATRSIQFRCSESVTAPCVTLYGGRTIYLPVDWVQWSDCELSAAIAHESAHLRRNDPSKRLIGQLTASLMIFHPLAIWLSRGVMLSQEMAADREAATTQGDRFVNSLSRMALRIDSAAELPSRGLTAKQWLMRPGIVSVSSSHLIRRIEMLTTYPLGSVSRKFRILSHLALIGVFAASASWTVRADQPTDTAPQASETPAERVASLPKRDEHAETPLFASPSFEPWDALRPNHTGFVAVRAEKLLVHPVFGDTLLSFLNPHLDTGWKMIATEKAASKRVSLGIALENLEYVIASLNVEMTKKEAADGEGPDSTSTITAGSDGGMLRFKRPISQTGVKESIDKDRIIRVLQEYGIGKGDFDFGIESPGFVEDFISKTFVDGETRHDLVLMPEEKEFDENQLARLQRAWRAVDGGAVAACWTLSETLGFVENQYDEQAEKIHANAACMAIGVDFAAGTEPAHLRMVFVPRADVSPTELEALIRNLVTLTEQNMDSLVENAEDAEDADRFRKIFRSNQIRLTRSSDQGQLDCVMVNFRIPIDAFHLLLGL